MTSPEDYQRRLDEVMRARRAIAMQRSRARRRARQTGLLARLWRRVRFSGRTGAALAAFVARS